jgi:hypothetical protein
MSKKLTITVGVEEEVPEEVRLIIESEVEEMLTENNIKHDLATARMEN